MCESTMRTRVLATMLRFCCLAFMEDGGPRREGGGVWVLSLSSETTAKGTGLAESAGKEDPVELDSSLTL